MGAPRVTERGGIARDLTQPRRAVTHSVFPVNGEPSWSHHCCSLLPGRKQKLFTMHRHCVCLELCWEMPRPGRPSSCLTGDGVGDRAVFSGLGLWSQAHSLCQAGAALGT